MAIALGTNDLKIYRRHIAACARYPGLKKKPDTFKPNSKKEQMEDTCECPIWCRGYLAKETEIVGGQLRPKRVFGSLGCHNWTPAQKEVARLYECGSFPTVESAARPGLRISDAHKFSDSEIVRNESNHGWNASFIMKKTKKRCVVPLPDHVVKMLKKLPGRVEEGKKYFFTCGYSALRERVDTLAVRAQREKPFKHPFSPHCLRHTFAIQHLNQGTDIKLVSKWLGHKSVAITIAHYSNWIGTTKKLAEDVSREANARMMAEMDSLPA